MKLTARNYYSTKANQEYFSVSQFKAFQKCEASAMAELKGEYTPDRGRALILGSFVDEMLTGTQKSKVKFMEDNRDQLFKKNGEYYADVAQAVEAVERVKAQPLMMKYLNGGHQKIMTGEIEGVPFKIKMDSYKPGEFIADLKYLRDTRSPNLFQNVVSYWGYDLQGAVYREIVRQNTGEILPFYLVIVTKEKPIHLAVVEVNDFNLNNSLDVVKKQIRRFQSIKFGEIVPERCEEHDCDYCAETIVLTEPIDSDLLGLSKRQLNAMEGVM